MEAGGAVKAPDYNLRSWHSAAKPGTNSLCDLGQITESLGAHFAICKMRIVLLFVHLHCKLLGQGLYLNMHLHSASTTGTDHSWDV